VAPARDGARVPISLVYRRDFKRRRSRPLMLYGYGSYGYSTDASFSVARLSLLDRGFAVALATSAAARSSGATGTRTANCSRRRTPSPTSSTAPTTSSARSTRRPTGCFAQGGSAGGLLIGAVVNLRPDLFKGAVAQVPFVDVVTTMLDSSIPLTTSEYDEWGDAEQGGVLRLHDDVLPLRQRRAAGVPQPARDDRAARLPGAVLGAGQVGGEACAR